MRLNSLRPAVRIIGLILVLGLIVGGWYLGGEWWNVKGYVPRAGRLASRWETFGASLGLLIVCYVLWVIDRYRKRS